MTEAQLHPAAAADTEDPDDKKRNRNQVGIENVLQPLEAKSGQQKPVQKGETLEQFSESTQHRRRRGERMTDWLIRFDTGLQQLRENEVDLDALDDVAGWFLMRKAGPTAERRECVVGNLPDEHSGYQRIRGLLVRMFPDVRATERRAPPSRSWANESRSRGGWRSS
eukprot:3818433-Pyramimonas_sp.AAC.1